MKKLKKFVAGALAVSSMALCMTGISVSASEEDITPYSVTDSNNIGTYIMIGDVYLDGKISITDAVNVEAYICGALSFTEIQRRAADVDGNGIIEKNDSYMIQQHLANIITSFPCQSYIIGDVNLDGTIDINDVYKMLLYIMNKEDLSITEHRAADINNDGTVDMNDLSALSAYLT